MVLRAERDFARQHRILGLLVVVLILQITLNMTISQENQKLYQAVGKIVARQNIYVVEGARRGEYDPLPEASRSRAFVDFLVHSFESFDNSTLSQQMQAVRPYVSDGLFTRIKSVRERRISDPDSGSLFTMSTTPQFIPSPDPQLQTVRVRGNLQTLDYGALQEVQSLEIVLTYSEVTRTQENQFGYVVTDYEVRRRSQ